jgi:hypothetical protein
MMAGGTLKRSSALEVLAGGDVVVKISSNSGVPVVFLKWYNS